jgi:hypothetical protein
MIDFEELESGGNACNSPATTATEWLFVVAKGSPFLTHPLTNVR